jgi:transposase InsO family protein
MSRVQRLCGALPTSTSRRFRMRIRQRSKCPLSTALLGIAPGSWKSRLRVRRIRVTGSDHGSQYPSIRYTDRLTENGVTESVGSVGDSYNSPLAETVIELFKGEVIYARGPWRSLEAVESLPWNGTIGKMRAWPSRPDSNSELSGDPGALCAGVTWIISSFARDYLRLVGAPKRSMSGHVHSLN